MSIAYKALVVERAAGGIYRPDVFMLSGERQEDGVMVNGHLIASDGWFDDEMSAMHSLADQIEKLGEELVDRAGRMREAM